MNNVISRIKKILALANCPGASEGEIQNATAKAHRLLEQHHLSMMDIAEAEDAHNSVIQEHNIHTQTERLSINKRLIVAGVAKAFDCKTIFKKTRAGGIIFTLIGFPEDIQVAAQMYDMLTARLPVMGRDRAKQHGCFGRGETRAFVTAYILGAVEAIIKRVKRERDLREAANCKITALVVRKESMIKDYSDDKYGKIKSAPKSKSRANAAGRDIGYIDGTRMGLHRPIGDGKN